MNCWPVLTHPIHHAAHVYRALHRIRRVRRAVRVIVCAGAIAGAGAVPLGIAWDTLPPREGWAIVPHAARLMVVPEPGGMVVLVGGLLVLVGVRGRRG